MEFTVFFFFSVNYLVGEGAAAGEVRGQHRGAVCSSTGSGLVEMPLPA